MNVSILDTGGRSQLVAVHVTKDEALQLVRSLLNQIIENNPNASRLESRCGGDAREFTIYVLDRELPS